MQIDCACRATKSQKNPGGLTAGATPARRLPGSLNTNTRARRGDTALNAGRVRDVKLATVHQAYAIRHTRLALKRNLEPGPARGRSQTRGNCTDAFSLVADIRRCWTICRSSFSVVRWFVHWRYCTFRYCREGRECGRAASKDRQGLHLLWSPPIAILNRRITEAPEHHRACCSTSRRQPKLKDELPD